MTAQLQAEMLKLRTTRTVALLALAALGLTVLGSLSSGLSPALSVLASEHGQRTLFSAESSGVFFATVAGVIVMTNEFRYGTIRPTLLVQPRRRVVLAAKLASAGLVGVLLAMLCALAAFAAGHAILSVRGVSVALSASQQAAMAAGTLAAGALSAICGVTVGALIRNQVGAILALVAYAFLVDAVLFAALPAAGRFLPGKAGDALGGLPATHLVAPSVGAIVLLGWAALFVVAATIRTDRSDV